MNPPIAAPALALEPSGLRFSNAVTESEYRQWRTALVIPGTQVAVLATIIMWATGTATGWLAAPEAVWKAVPVGLAGVVPICLATIIATVLASRLCARATDGEILFCPQTARAIEPRTDWRDASLRLKGFADEIAVKVASL